MADKNFVVKNGLEVNTNLIFANKDDNRVGIATTVTSNTLQVNGGIGATSLHITGVSTVNSLKINGRITAGSSLGISGQYLVSTGAGITWVSVPQIRVTDVQTAGVGATTFSTTYTVGLLDVYINGVKLTASEFTATNGATVALDDACFGGETVEFVSYSSSPVAAGFTGIAGITVLDEGSPVGGALQVTSLNFVGASVTAVGSGLGVTVSLSNYVSNAGIATDVISGIASVTQLNVSGITTLGVVTASNIYSTGIITATNGFTSGIGVTDPVQITVTDNILTFNVVGVGSTSFTLF
jgi:hypothetical protein